MPSPPLISLQGKVDWATFEVVAGASRNNQPRTRSVIRWYNDHEICAEILEDFSFEKVKRFCMRPRALSRADDEAAGEDDWADELAALDSKLVSFFPNDDAAFKLELELSLLLHYGRPLAQACYFLEGDRPLLPYLDGHLRHCRRVLSSGSAFFNTPC